MRMLSWDFVYPEFAVKSDPVALRQLEQWQIVLYMGAPVSV